MATPTRHRHAASAVVGPGLVARAGAPVSALAIPCAGAQRRECVLSVVIPQPFDPECLAACLLEQRWVLVRVAAPPSGTKLAASVMYCEECAREDVGSDLVDAAFEQYRLSRLAH